MTNPLPTFDAITKAGRFTGQDGKERNAYRTIGAAWPDKDGGIGCIKLEVLPMQWDGTIYLRPRQELEEGDAQ